MFGGGGGGFDVENFKNIDLAKVSASRPLVVDENGFIASSAISNTELEFLSTVHTNVQTQLNAREPSFLVDATMQKHVDLGNGDITLRLSSNVSTTELDHLIGVSSAIQTQLNSKAALNGANFTGMVSVIGTTVQAPLIPTAGGVYIGSFGATGDYKLELCAATGSDLAYIDFSIPNSDYKGRIIYNSNAGTLNFISNNIPSMVLDGDVIVENNLRTDVIKPKTTDGTITFQDTAGADILKCWNNQDVEIDGS